MMVIAQDDPGPVLDERVLIERLPLSGARAVELGCGTARQTRLLAASGKFRSILALEVDRVQHERNLQLDDLPSVRFAPGGAQDIPAGDAAFDAVFLFKSLHHVPIHLLGDAFSEIRRVLAPGGLVYISEPVFAGDYNEILRLFHDEQRVREEAFAATREAVAAGLFRLVSQAFFRSQVRYRSFDDFEQKVIKVSHTEHRLSAALLEEVRARFEAHMAERGGEFLAPFRVDLLERL